MEPIFLFVVLSTIWRRSSIQERKRNSVSLVRHLTTTWRAPDEADDELTVSTTVLSPSPWNDAHGSDFVSSGMPLTASTYSPSFTSTPDSSSGERTDESHGPPRTMRLIR